MTSGANLDPRRLADLLPRFTGVRAWVIGDVMLDEHLSGDADRVSPEAPVPVVLVRNREVAPGGAANVALNLAALGASVELCGVVGEDAAGDELLRACAAQGVGTGAMARLAGHETVRKVRVAAGRHPVLRLDFESPRPIAAETWAPLLAHLALGAPPAVVIVSDYSKGFLGPELLGRAMALAAAAGAPVLVDPKVADVERYRGATLVKPNLAELRIAVGRTVDPMDPTAVERAGREVLERTGAQALVVTLGERGIVVLERGQAPVAIPAPSVEVVASAGAGDTLLAAAALALGVGAGVTDAARLGSAAAGAVLARPGTTRVGLDALRAALTPAPRAERLDESSLAARVAEWRRAGKRIVFTNGCFDLLHPGHLTLLHEAAACGDVLLVAINSDRSVARLKGPGRPVMPERERAEIIAALEFVSGVVVFDEETPLRLIEAVRPDVLVKGDDYALEEIVGRDEVESWGGRVVRVPRTSSHSTSELVRRIIATSE